eukprot:1230014-Rhodomonas_salina.1
MCCADLAYGATQCPDPNAHSVPAGSYPPTRFLRDVRTELKSRLVLRLGMAVLRLGMAVLRLGMAVLRLGMVVRLTYTYTLCPKPVLRLGLGVPGESVEACVCNAGFSGPDGGQCEACAQ